MSSKIIIKNETSINDIDILKVIEIVINGGLSSNGRYGEQYCFVTTMRFDRKNIMIYADKTKNGTHVFTIRKDLHVEA